MTVQLRQLRYFTGIVDAGSFSRAALTLHVAQPALSQQIAELELDLGVPLLQRSARGTQPTAAGGLIGLLVGILGGPSQKVALSFEQSGRRCIGYDSIGILALS